MSNLCNQDLESAAVDKEACTVNDIIPHPQSSSEPPEEEEEEDSIHYITRNIFFDVIMAKSHLPPHCHLFMPSFMIPILPRDTAPVVLRHAGKNWDLSYTGKAKAPRFDIRWKTFVVDNHLKMGDACVFELMENSKTNLRFKVHILRHDDLPDELLERKEFHGVTPKSAILVD